MQSCRALSRLAACRRTQLLRFELARASSTSVLSSSASSAAPSPRDPSAAGEVARTSYAAAGFAPPAQQPHHTAAHSGQSAARPLPAAGPSSPSSSSSSPHHPLSPSPTPPHPLPPPLRVTPLQRLLVGAGAAVAGFVDPSRADMIALLGELTGERALRKALARMRESEEGRGILRDRPRIRASGVAALRPTFPAGSFGAAYASFLDAHGFDPDDRGEVRFVRDPQLAYVMQRHREAHDLWHVLAGLPPTLLGETAVKWLEMVQTGLPVAALSALAAPARLRGADERRLFWSVYAPWASRVGSTCAHLLSVRYEDRWARPLDEVRRELRFPAAPAPGHGGPREGR